jgi:predicted ABC-type sugar transport system permease subunit
MSSRAEARRAKRDLNGNTSRGRFIAVLHGVPWVVLVVLVVVVAYSFLLGRTRFGLLFVAVAVDITARHSQTNR